MKLTIVGSSAFKELMLEYQKKLVTLGHEAIVHPDYQAFVNGEKQDIWDMVTHGEHAKAKRENNYIMWYHDAIKNSDGILVLNFDKKGIKNYIGGNTLMEIAFAYVLGKKIFLINPIPDSVSYVDEIKAMVDETNILNGDLDKIS